MISGISINEEPLESLRRLSSCISSNFVDYKLLSKRSIHNLNSEGRELKNECINSFTLSTCLRREIHSFNKEAYNNRYGYASLSGKLAMRRLMTVGCGLHSEIIGEKEIFLQMTNSITDAYNKSLVSRHLCNDLFNLLKIINELKNKIGISTDENYSTVGASIILNHIKPDSTLCIIGSGYMANVFINKFKLIQYDKIIWISRDIHRLKKLVSKMDIDTDKVIFVNSNDSIKYILGADLIFAATNNYAINFNYLKIPQAKAIVDVSYPPLFSENCNKNYMSIQNTFFEKLIRKPVCKNKILEAEIEIDHLIDLL